MKKELPFWPIIVLGCTIFAYLTLILVLFLTNTLPINQNTVLFVLTLPSAVLTVSLATFTIIRSKIIISNIQKENKK